MNNAIFACKNCGYRQDLEAVHAGKEFSCPTCNTVVRATLDTLPSSEPQKTAALGNDFHPLQSSAKLQKSSFTKEKKSEEPFEDKPGSRISEHIALLLSAIPKIRSNFILSSNSTVSAARSGRATLLHVIHMYDNPLFFVLSYVVCMLFSYWLPSPGHTAAVNNGFLLSADGILIFLSIFQCLACVMLVVICLFRGMALNRLWLPAYPALILFYLCTPRLALLPYIPGVLHGLAIILGLVSIEEKKRKP